MYELEGISKPSRLHVESNSYQLQAGYYCSVCDCILRDSASYLDHINGKYHNRALGMSMRVERSTADQVKLPGQAAALWLKLLTHVSMSEHQARAFAGSSL